MKIDLRAWEARASATGVPREMIGYLRWRPQMLDREDGCDMVSAYEELAVHPFMQHAEARKFFVTLLMEFLPFAEIFDALPNSEDVLQNPSECKIPEEDAIVHALVASLARRATVENADNLFVLMRRLFPEFAKVLYNDMLVHCPKIKETPACKAWEAETEGVFTNLVKRIVGEPKEETEEEAECR